MCSRFTDNRGIMFRNPAVEIDFFVLRNVLDPRILPCNDCWDSSQEAKQPRCEVDLLLLKLRIRGAILSSFMECRGTTVVLRFTFVDNYMILVEDVIFMCVTGHLWYLYTRSVCYSDEWTDNFFKILEFSRHSRKPVTQSQILKKPLVVSNTWQMVCFTLGLGICSTIN